MPGRPAVQLILHTLRVHWPARTFNARGVQVLAASRYRRLLQLELRAVPLAACAFLAVRDQVCPCGGC